MTQVISNMPVGTIGLRASGKVSEEDYRDVLVPTIDAALEQGKVRLLVRARARGRLQAGPRVGRHGDVVQGPQGMGAPRHRLGRRLARERRQGVRLVDTSQVEVLESDDVRDAKQRLVGLDDD